MFRALKVPTQYPLVLLLKAGCRRGRAFSKECKVSDSGLFRLHSKIYKGGEQLLCLGRIVSFAFGGGG